MTTPADFSHHVAKLDRLKTHYVREGAEGRLPLLMLHGWPEFWYAYHQNIPALAEHFDVIVPDLRGFGDTEDLPGIPSITDYADDILALADHLGLDRFGIVTHDLGAVLAMDFGRRLPERVPGLFFFNCPNPGVGARWAEADHHIEVWYQSFHRLPVAHELVGLSADTVRIYFRHFLEHWSYQGCMAAELEHWVDTYAKPGRVEGSFKFYKSWAETRLRIAREGPPKLPKITVPARVLWGAEDPVNKPEWRDNLPDYFENVQIDLAPEAGHFVHYDQPDLANAEITKFFNGL